MENVTGTVPAVTDQPLADPAVTIVTIAKLFAAEGFTAAGMRDQLSSPLFLTIADALELLEAEQ
jgi:hypothetical protein